MRRVKNSTGTMTPIKPYQDSKTFRIFSIICKIVYFSCGTNFCFENMDYPASFKKVFNGIYRVLGIVAIGVMISEWGAFWTQSNLTEEQSNYRMTFAFSHAIIYTIYLSVVYYKREIRELVKTLAVELKQVYNDEFIENMMIKSTIWSLIVMSLVFSLTLVSFGIRSGIGALTTNATFTTIIPVWPDVEDRSLIAGAARIVHYITWWILVVKVVSVYIIVLTSTIGLGHQFKNLCKYFEQLNDIFEGPGNQEEKEWRYEAAFKVGIKMHSVTLWCTRQTRLSCGVAFSGQVVLNVSTLLLLMIQMSVTERTLIGLMPIMFMASAVLIGTAVFLWNAGDVTIEASRLPTAMFHSGWHNCTKQSSVRVRKLVTVAITQAQKRVLIKGLGFIELSYDSYVSIVKSSYSAFSVIY